MKIKELIDKLSIMDPELEICCEDRNSEYYYPISIEEIHIETLKEMDTHCWTHYDFGGKLHFTGRKRNVAIIYNPYVRR